MAPIEQARRVIELIVCSIVDNADAVKIETEFTPPLLLFKITVSSEDMANVIGRQGRMARALRITALAMGMKLGLRFSITIAENDC